MNIQKKIFFALYNRTLFRMKVRLQLAEIPGLLEYLWRVRNDPEIMEILRYVRLEPKSMIPYAFTNKYKVMAIEISRDKKTGFIRARVDDRNIYFPASFSEKYALESVRVGLMEQDEQSPHRYIHSPGEKFSGKYAVLAGASDCMFALKVAPNFEKIFLFEADKRWHEPMLETMREFVDKLEIVPKWIGDTDSVTSISLDSFFSQRYQNVNFIQADIEGDEMKMLFGAQKLIESAEDLKLSLSCYHKAHHEQEIGDFLRARGFFVRPSEGYMLLWMQHRLQYPYLRRGLIYAGKNNVV